MDSPWNDRNEERFLKESLIVGGMGQRSGVKDGNVRGG